MKMQPDAPTPPNKMQLPNGRTAQLPERKIETDRDTGEKELVALAPGEHTPSSVRMHPASDTLCKSTHRNRTAIKATVLAALVASLRAVTPENQRRVTSKEANNPASQTHENTNFQQFFHLVHQLAT